MNTIPYHFNIRLKRIFSSIVLLLLALGATAQTGTYLAPPVTLTTTLAAGSYYNYTGITLNPNFSFTAAAGSSLSLYIANPDCQLLTNSFSQNQNYIVTSTPRMAMKTFSTSGLTGCDVMQTVQYIDGLGRPLQTVQVKGSTSNKDMVQPFVYDQFGREVQKYLPYAAQGTADGSYKSTAVSDQGLFYNSPPSGSGVSQITVPYAITNFEASPLNRVVEQGAPGQDWQPSGTTGHTLKTVYTTNNETAIADTSNTYFVAMYKATVNSDGTRNLVHGTATQYYYPAGQLYVTVSKDENWKSSSSDNSRGGTSEEYKDKEGHVILKRLFNFVPGSPGTLQILSTYYVYDDLGNLSFVLTPASGADTAPTNTIPSNAVLDGLCYQYRYDERNRLTEKKMPGKDWEYMVYNLLDQVVFTQDGNQRSKSPQDWSYTKYDALGRVIISGVEGNHMETRAALQIYVTTTLSNTSSGMTECETRNASGPQGYTNTSFPTGAGAKALKVDYYDSYDNLTGVPSNYIFSGYSTLTEGLLTASKMAVLNTIGNAVPDMLANVHYYDDKGREVLVYQQHYFGGTLSTANFDATTTTYNFNDQVTTHTRQHYTATGGGLKLIHSLRYLYDHTGRKQKTWSLIQNNGQAGDLRTLLSEIDYNELGQVWKKNLHSTDSVNFRQTVTYAYNERGWVTSSLSDQFNMHLYYNDAPSGKQYNGNIVNQLWQAKGGRQQHIPTVTTS